MKFRAIFICLFAFLPFAALADDTTTQAQAPQTAVGASDLLPQSGTTNSGTSSTGASSVLQPNSSSLQGSSADGSNLSAPSNNSLQAGTASDNLKVILGGEADGSPKNVNYAANTFGEDLAFAAAGVLLLCIVVLYLRRQAMRPMLIEAVADTLPDVVESSEPVNLIADPSDYIAATPTAEAAPKKRKGKGKTRRH